ncbi:hypothetical protein BN14_10733 [Rhizoctonia solani AG-1 IB]|uniref:Uncharacterized protein n=1 Tax=Thanatephorus cucumeris (strain AG1-IB / isolate 7/3/14) TaxID=1108050 RepID=M5CGR8_THACB|nr:hypothetical protein BN14_10733 [Rhizoctonia solani AG-1 IB]
MDLYEGIIGEDALNDDVLDLLAGQPADQGCAAPPLPGPAVAPQPEAAALAPSELSTPSTDKSRREPRLGPAPGPLLVPAPLPLQLPGRPYNLTLTAIPDPVERVPLNPPLRPAPDPNQRGAVGLQINDLSSKVSRAIQTVENLVYVEDPPTRTKDRGQTKDRRHKLSKGAAKPSVPEPASNDRVHGEGDRQAHTGDRGSLVVDKGKQGDFETLRTVEAPESSVGDDTSSTSGSDSGAEPAARGDDPAVRNATDHVAKWTTLGPDAEMRDAGKGLKTIEPEQPCVSPQRLELKQSSTR